MTTRSKGTHDSKITESIQSTELPTTTRSHLAPATEKRFSLHGSVFSQSLSILDTDTASPETLIDLT